MRVRANGLSLPDLDTLAALETGRYWTPAKRPSEPLYRPATNNGLWAEDIITDGLVLYVPLWLYSGAKFPSVDAYKHTCTVTGALWTPQGRSFDGVGDFISVPDSISLDYTNCTYACWIKISSTGVTSAYGRIIMSKGTTSDRWILGLSYIHHATVGSRKLIFCADVFAGAAIYTANLSDDTWHFVTGVYDGTPHLYLDGNLVDDGTADTWTVNNQSLMLGGGQANRYLKCVMGEGIVNNQVLSQPEFQQIYLATKWRYA